MRKHAKNETEQPGETPCQFSSHNSVALKHGGYARRLLLPDDIIEDSEAITLIDELRRFIAVNLIASANIGRMGEWANGRMGEELRDVENNERRDRLLNAITNSDKAVSRNAVRIESINRTLRQMSVNAAMLEKILAEVEYRYAATEKVKAETERLRLGPNGGDVIVVHHALGVPGALHDSSEVQALNRSPILLLSSGSLRF